MWRRLLLAWEEDSVRECTLLLLSIVLQEHIRDRWKWLLDPVQGYSDVGLTISLRHLRTWWTGAAFLKCGIITFLQRYLFFFFFCGVYFEIVFLPKIILCDVECYNLLISCVLPDVAAPRQQSISFLDVTSLVAFGI